MYPVPPSLLLRRSFCHLVPFSLVVCGSDVMSYLEWGVGRFEFVGGEGGRGVVLPKCLPKLQTTLELQFIFYLSFMG